MAEVLLDYTKEMFAEDLRSGKYGQCTGRLHIKDDGYCCLGVYAERVGGIEGWIDVDQPDGAMRNVFADSGTGLNEGSPARVALARTFHIPSGHVDHDFLVDRLHGALIGFNDNGRSFEWIAFWVEEMSDLFLSSYGREAHADRRVRAVEKRMNDMSARRMGRADRMISADGPVESS